MINFSNHTDNELLASLKQGNEIAFTEIYNRYWKKMYTVIINKLEDYQEAEEIVQNIFISLWKRRKTLEITSSLNSYLAVCVKYRVIKTLDKRFREKAYINGLPANSLIDNSTQEWIAFGEIKTQLNEFVEQLPEKCKLVYKLSKEQGFPQKKIAEDLGISQKTVEAHLSKALKNLKSKLDIFFSALL